MFVKAVLGFFVKRLLPLSRAIVGRLLIVSLLVLMVWSSTITAPIVDAQTRIAALVLGESDGKVASGVIDTTRGFAYFGVLGVGDVPDRIVKVDLTTFTRVGEILLGKDEIPLEALIDPDAGYAYFTVDVYPPTIAKIDLSAFKRVATTTLLDSDLMTTCADIDTARGFAYFGTFASRIWKVRLSDLARIGAITLGNDEVPESIIIDSAKGYAYLAVGTSNAPSKILKVDISGFKRVAVLPLNEGEESLYHGILDSDNGYAYFVAYKELAILVKIDLFNFTRTGTLELSSLDGNPVSVVIDAQRGFAYVGSDAEPGVVVKIDLSTFTQVGTLKLNEGEDKLEVAVIDPQKRFAYFGTYTSPGMIVKVGLVESSATSVATNTPSAISSVGTTSASTTESTITGPGIPSYAYGIAAIALAGLILAVLLLYRQKRTSR